jgi:hypothetical protein
MHKIFFVALYTHRQKLKTITTIVSIIKEILGKKKRNTWINHDASTLWYNMGSVKTVRCMDPHALPWRGGSHSGKQKCIM